MPDAPDLSPTLPRRLPRRLSLRLLSALAALGIGLAGWFTFDHAQRLFLDETARRGDNVLQLAVTSLRGEMARYERLPHLLADHALVKALANSPDDPGLASLVNTHLKGIQALLGASDIYLMDTGGTTRAASNFDTETSFVGGNFAFRPYFHDAINGGEGRFYALGTTSRKRGYYFGAPVRVAGVIRGVLVVKIDLDAIEQAWRGDDYQVIVTDPEGILFLSSNPDWLFSALTPLTPGQRAGLAENRRYVDATLMPFPLMQVDAVGGHSVLKVAGNGSTRAYLALSQPMPEADWTIRVMLETASARQQALSAAVVVILGLGLGLMALAVVVQRRARLRERLHLQRAAQNQLERRVEERTHELAEVNTRLEAEVAERRLAEQNLRQAQADLVQAGKLAALGQMSAALSHEFNQPLGAARTYADNALVLMDRGRSSDARDNIARILSLIERMTAISKHLRSFARKPGQRLAAVALAEVVEAAAEIAGLRLKAADAVLTVALPDDLPPVVAGPVRLQQVLVNILTNAADAVEGLPVRHVALTAERSGQDVVIHIADSGPGVPAAISTRIFDPFFSTKGVGKGLGLGLSISYNIIKDFGGDLQVGRTEDVDGSFGGSGGGVGGGGARFTIRLKIADAASLAGVVALPQAAE